MSTKRNASFVTPRAVVGPYPRLDQPYKWSMQQKRTVPDLEGSYECKIVLGKSDAAPLVQGIKDAIKASGITPENFPYKKEIDKDTGKETGNVVFTFKDYGKTRDGKTKFVRFFDGKAKPIPRGFRLTAGSEVKIEAYVSVAPKGARLNILSVQVLKYVPQASSFKEETDAFAYDPSDFPTNQELAHHNAEPELDDDLEIDANDNKTTNKLDDSIDF